MARGKPSEPQTNQIAIVTGASEGIGKAITFALLRSGRTVHAVSRNQQKLDHLLVECQDCAGHVFVHTADATVPGEINQLVRSIFGQEKRIDILVNNVGQGLKRELIDTTDEEWAFLIAVNLSSAFYACRAVLPIMRKQQRGWVVNIASRAGRRGEGQFGAYSAMKHGMIGMTRSLADSESDYHLRVNAVCPGPVSTQKMLERYPNMNQAGCVSPEDVAEAVLFLLSPAAAAMNGQCMDLFPKEGSE